MFGLFRPKPPLSPWEKAWTESRLSTFAEQLGMQGVLQQDTLLPNDSRLPSSTGREGAEEMFRFLSEWIQCDAQQLQLQIYGETIAADQLQSLGEGVRTVPIHEAQLDQRETLIAVLSWHLARERLARSTPALLEQSDQGWTTDLLPVFFGLGYFAANTPLREAGEEPVNLSWWGKRQRAYLPSRVFGYALALRSYVRQESSPLTAADLRPDALAALNEGERYLEKTGDTDFTREADRGDRQPPAALLDTVRDGSPSKKICAIWELGRLSAGESGASWRDQAASVLLPALRDKEPEVRAVAAAAIGEFDRSPESAQDLADNLRDSSEEVRIASASALSQFPGVDDQTLVADLTEALQDGERLVVINAARSLVAYGEAAEPAVKALLKRVRQALVECRDSDALLLLAAVDALVPDARERLDAAFDEHDAELSTMAGELWQRLQESAEAQSADAT